MLALSSSTPHSWMEGVSKDVGPSSYTGKPNSLLVLIFFHLSAALAPQPPSWNSAPCPKVRSSLSANYTPAPGPSSTSPSMTPHLHLQLFQPSDSLRPRNWSQAFLLTPSAQAAVSKSHLMPCKMCSTPPAFLPFQWTVPLLVSVA